MLFAAPANGDASVRGCIFGVDRAASAGRVTSRARDACRGEMDVASYMAAMTPVATVAVLPLALMHGDMLSITAHGWMYIVLLTLMTGVLAHGLMVFAQSTIPIGSIGIAQIAQPALAALWSFLLLDETLPDGSSIGMAIVIAGLLGFVLLNQRKNLQSGHARPDESDQAGLVVVESTRASSTQVRPGVSNIGWPSSAVSVNGLSRSSRVHLPCTTLPPVNRKTSPVPSGLGDRAWRVDRRSARSRRPARRRWRR